MPHHLTHECIGFDVNAAVGFNIDDIGHGEYLAKYAVLIKRLKIMKQSRTVNRIDGQ